MQKFWKILDSMMIIIWQSHLGFLGRSARSTMKGKCYWVTLLTQNISSLISKPLPNEIKVTIDICIRSAKHQWKRLQHYTFSMTSGRLKKLVNLAIEKRPRPGVNTIMNPDILVPINMELIKHSWKPTIFIYNIKTYKVQYVLDSLLAGLWIAANKMLLLRHTSVLI